MRFTIFTTGLVAAIMSETVYGASCVRSQAVWGIVGYAINAQGVDDVPKVCGDLWSNLRRFHDCIGVGVPSCEKRGNNELVWNFSNGSGCNMGMVESTWWEATQNRYGAIKCEIQY
ncbi:hypothetical protein DM02DRAFT_695445 [Periconia macrospinosa]|uniref:Uncharacterized protein n=1 Tax=Periconia macrospinosa TaxID=97972 RepID=A0A2V1D655_9PLEO|nr:hypothetical protein DM02DRAFT_695445 [Periconia macrospinosa]